MSDYVPSESSEEITFPNGDRKKPSLYEKNCLDPCQYLDFNFQLSSQSYPNPESFILTQYFCETALKVWRNSCTNPNKRFLLTVKYEKICSMIEEKTALFVNQDVCQNWTVNYLQYLSNKTEGTFPHNILAKDLNFTSEILRYAKDNLIRLSVFFKTPSVSVTERFPSMTFTGFIANTGGLLGLCIGCSIMSFLEIVFHCLVKNF